MFYFKVITSNPAPNPQQLHKQKIQHLQQMQIKQQQQRKLAQQQQQHHEQLQLTIQRQQMLKSVRALYEDKHGNISKEAADRIFADFPNLFLNNQNNETKERQNFC